MNKKIIKAMFALFFIFLAACSTEAKNKLGLRKVGPDASVTKQQKALIVPPVLNHLPKPSANTAIN